MLVAVGKLVTPRVCKTRVPRDIVRSSRTSNTIFY